MKIEQIMTGDVKFLSSVSNLDQAAQMMWEADCGALPVVNEDNKITGLLTDRDIAMAAYTQGQNLLNISVASAMANSIFSCKPGDDVQQALEIMGNQQIRRVPVVDDDDKVVGIVSLNDIAIACKQNRKAIPAPALADTLAMICDHREIQEEPVSETTEEAADEKASDAEGLATAAA